jgi:YfiH family protein
MSISPFFKPDWPAPANIKSITTTRHGGVSISPYDQLNLGLHVGDHKHHVEQNRQQIVQLAQLPEHPRWLNQVHGTQVTQSKQWSAGTKADAISSQEKNHVCAIMTADCLPILLCNQQGDTVAAIHAGWRGLAAGIIEKTLHSFACDHSAIIAWLGPAIGPNAFEVGSEVVELFVKQDPQAFNAFKQTDSQHFLANIYLLAQQRLNLCGVTKIYGGECCTVSNPNRFFSYRRDGVTGRMASMIWIEDK